MNLGAMLQIVYDAMGYTNPSAAQTRQCTAMINEGVKRITRKREYPFRLRQVDVTCTLADPTPDLPKNFPSYAKSVTALDDGRPIPRRPMAQDIVQEGDPSLQGGGSAECYDVAWNATTSRWTFVPQPPTSGTQVFRVRYLAASDELVAVTDEPPWNSDYHGICPWHAIAMLAVGGSFDAQTSANARNERDLAERSLMHTSMGSNEQERLPNYNAGTQQWPPRGQGG